MRMVKEQQWKYNPRQNDLKVFRPTSSCVKKKIIIMNKRPLKDMESPSAAVSKILHLVIIESYGLMVVKTLKLIGI